MNKMKISMEEAEIVAIQATAFLAGDETRLARFLALSGAQPADLAAGVRDPGFLVGVLDHLLGDETLLFLFCDHVGLPVDVPGSAHKILAGQNPGDSRP